MKIQRFIATILTDGGGDGSVQLDAVRGAFLQVLYVPDGGSPLNTGADLTITENQTGLNLLTQANIGTVTYTKAPRQVTADAATGTNGTILDYIFVAEDITVTIANGGAAKTGVFYVYFNE